MSNGPHIDPEGIGGIEDFPASHPARQHLEGCARCRAALEAYRAFLEPAAGIPAADLAEARARLKAARESPGGAGSVRAVAPPVRRRWWAFPMWRPAWALAAAAIVVVALYSAYSDRFRSEDSVTLRGTDEAPFASVGGSGPETIDVTRDRDGAWRLRWRSVAGADGYRVTLFAADLEVVARFEAARDTSLLLPADAVEGVTKPGETGRVLYWQVAALRGGEETSTSAMAPLPPDPRATR